MTTIGLVVITTMMGVLGLLVGATWARRHQLRRFLSCDHTAAKCFNSGGTWCTRCGAFRFNFGALWWKPSLVERVDKTWR